MASLLNTTVDIAVRTLDGLDFWAISVIGSDGQHFMDIFPDLSLGKKWAFDVLVAYIDLVPEDAIEVMKKAEVNYLV